jgi:1-deoxy-D-xylulose-5-phosphate synthase
LCGMDEEGIYKVITKNELRMDAPVESCMATHS